MIVHIIGILLILLEYLSNSNLMNANINNCQHYSGNIMGMIMNISISNYIFKIGYHYCGNTMGIS